jgi:hypothetical protein
MVADILDFKPETVWSFKTTEHRHGFKIMKVGAGKWGVRRMTKEQVAAEEGKHSGWINIKDDAA